MSEQRKPHICTDVDCIYLGKPSADSCRCHLTETENEIANLRSSLEQAVEHGAKGWAEAEGLRTWQRAALESRDIENAVIEGLRAQLAIARKALEPFAEMAGQLHPGVGNDEDVVTGWCAGFHLTAGHLRTAKAAYTDEQGK